MIIYRKSSNLFIRMGNLGSNNPSQIIKFTFVLKIKYNLDTSVVYNSPAPRSADSSIPLPTYPLNTEWWLGEGYCEIRMVSEHDG